MPNQRTLNTDQTVTYSCDSGFELSGQAQVTCLIDGNLSPKVPTCIRGEANLFTTITNKRKVFVFTVFILKLGLGNNLSYCLLPPLAITCYCAEIINTFRHLDSIVCF